MTTIRKWTAVFLFLLSCFAGSAAAADQVVDALRVNEGRILFHFLPRPSLQFAIFNPSNKPVTGSFAFELLDEKDWVRASLTGPFSEQPGETVETLEWPASKLPSNSPSSLGWYRLLYIFFPSPDSGLPVTGGIVQFGRVMRDGFELRMAAAEKVEPGTQYPVRLRVLSSPDGKPLARQQILVTMGIGDDDEKPVKRRATTDGAGNAMVTFTLPRKPEDDKGEITATVVRGAFEEEGTIEFEFPSPPPPGITMSTDKPLYQPGQTVHVRMTAFGPGRRALAGKKIDLAIADEEGQEQFHQKVTTSRFGIASADWVIPSMLQLGEQSLTAKLEDEDKEYNGEAGTGSQIRVSRYELPTYTVLVEPDRPYYLPGQNSVVDVHADYLFGKPVQHGKVKVVKQQERRWDYKNQKWEAEESEPVTGELGGDGHYRASIDLSQEFIDFQETGYQRFRDVSLAAYVTDASTGRTEQRRFKVRITKQPIHIYILEQSEESNARGIFFYVTSSYADGPPASVDGEISAALPIEEDDRGNRFDATKKTAIGRFHTNQYGIGRVELAPLPEPLIRITHGRERSYGDYYDPEQDSTWRNALLQLEAKDREGREGSESEEITVDRNEQFLRVRTNHTLYHPDESIEAEIATNAKSDEAIVSVWSREGLLRSQTVKLSEGRGKLRIPYEPRFHGEIYVSAYSMTQKKNEAGTLNGRQQVLFPTKEELDVKVRTLQLPDPREATGPFTVGLANVLEKGENSIEVVSTGKPGAMNAIVFASYYLPWGESAATTKENLASGENRALQLQVQYDRHEAKEGETVRCKVGAERIGFKGYGMMLAEVGLPPGAEVDRASLEEAKELGAGVSSYEVLPDRVVFYVWPTPGGSSFEFGFRLRYAMESWSAPSLVYDYYNPEAAATVMPVKFSIH